LSLVAKARKTIEGRTIGILVTDGSDGALVQSVRAAVEKAGARLQVVAPKIGGVKLKGGTKLAADHQLAGAPSVLFDAVVVAPSTDGCAMLVRDAAAVNWVGDAFVHLKVIGAAEAAQPLLKRAGVDVDEGVKPVNAPGDVGLFLAAVKNGRIWDREPSVRSAL
jgi:catalase